MMTTSSWNLPIPNFRIIGHRGAAALMPENTLASFKKAAELGLNWVEFDVQQCSTGEWIVMHDETLDRTTAYKGSVQHTPYDIIQTLEAGSWFSKDYANEKIPLFQEVLTLLPKLGLHPNIEIKTKGVNLNEIADSFLDCLDAFWNPQNLPPPAALATPSERRGLLTQYPLPLISSFNFQILKILKEKRPNLPIGYAIEEFKVEDLELVKKHQFLSLHCDYEKITQQQLEKAKESGVPILLYTINSSEMAKEWLQHGVFSVFSDASNSLVAEMKEI